MTDQETRIAFAERQGIKPSSFYCINCRECRNSDYGACPICGQKLHADFEVYTTDRNHVHAALMGMSEEEWRKFSEFFADKEYDEDIFKVSVQFAIIETLKTPLSTLVSCYLEATKGRIK